MEIISSLHPLEQEDVEELGDLLHRSVCGHLIGLRVFFTTGFFGSADLLLKGHHLSKKTPLKPKAFSTLNLLTALQVAERRVGKIHLHLDRAFSLSLFSPQNLAFQLLVSLARSSSHKSNNEWEQGRPWKGKAVIEEMEHQDFVRFFSPDNLPFIKPIGPKKPQTSIEIQLVLCFSKMHPKKVVLFKEQLKKAWFLTAKHICPTSGFTNNSTMFLSTRHHCNYSAVYCVTVLCRVCFLNDLWASEDTPMG